MPPKTMLLIGDDKISSRALAQVRALPELVVIDGSGSLSRVRAMLRRRSLTPALLAKMAAAEARRPAFDIASAVSGRIGSYKDLVLLLKQHAIQRLILFRAGLIIRRDVLDSVGTVLNIHSASLPEYGGIGVIDRALRDGAYDQRATLHRVTTRIDEGEVLDTEPYRLSPANSYFANEELAYAAGTVLLKRTLLSETI